MDMAVLVASILAFFGLVALGIFWLTFRLDILSIVMAVIVIPAGRKSTGVSRITG